MNVLSNWIKVLFNVSLLWSVFHDLNIAVPWPEVDISIKNVFGDYFYVLSEKMKGFFEKLNFLSNFAEQWNCSGALQIVTVITLLFTVVICIVILSKDLILLVAIKIKKYKKGKSSLVGKAIDKFSNTGVTLMIYTLQSLLVTCSRLVLAVLQSEGSCSTFDYYVQVNSQYYRDSFSIDLFFLFKLLDYNE